MRVLVTGGTGQLGRFIVAGLADAGHDVVLLGRTPQPGHALHAWSLAETAPNVPSADALVHAAFDHVPGRYRGGEGDDPARFLRLNRDGSAALFEAARRAGIPRWLFLSSRSVYGDHRRGEILAETDTPAPDSLYGEAKLATEQDMVQLAGAAATPVMLRATGIYGIPPGLSTHKWEGLFRDFLAGAEIEPRIATELHGADLAEAVRLLLEAPSEAARGTFNASDILLDRHDLLAGLKERTGAPRLLPPRHEGTLPGIMATEKLQRLGWRPGGTARLAAFLEKFASHWGSAHQTSGAQPIQSP